MTLRYKVLGLSIFRASEFGKIISPMCLRIKELYLSTEAKDENGEKDYRNGHTDVIVLLEKTQTSVQKQHRNTLHLFSPSTILWN